MVSRRALGRRRSPILWYYPGIRQKRRWETKRNAGQNSGLFDRDSNLEPSECVSRTLPINDPLNAAAIGRASRRFCRAYRRLNTWRILYSVMWRRVVRVKFTGIPEEHTVSTSAWLTLRIWRWRKDVPPKQCWLIPNYAELHPEYAVLNQTNPFHIPHIFL